MCSTRLVRAPSGRPLLCLVADTGAPDVGPRHAWRVLGDQIPVYSTSRARWLGTRSGRAPTSEEMHAARAPYHAPNYGRPMLEREPSDEELDEQAAIEAARLEQQRQPVDLIGAGHA